MVTINATSQGDYLQKKGWTAAELAAGADVPLETAQEWIDDKRAMTVDDIRSLKAAKGLHVSERINLGKFADDLAGKLTQAAPVEFEEPAAALADTDKLIPEDRALFSKIADGMSPGKVKDRLTALVADPSKPDFVDTQRAISAQMEDTVDGALEAETPAKVGTAPTNGAVPVAERPGAVLKALREKRELTRADAAARFKLVAAGKKKPVDQLIELESGLMKFTSEHVRNIGEAFALTDANTEREKETATDIERLKTAIKAPPQAHAKQTESTAQRSGAILKGIREGRGLSKDDAAKQFGMKSKEELVEIELGAKTIFAHHLEAITKALPGIDKGKEIPESKTQADLARLNEAITREEDARLARAADHKAARQRETARRARTDEARGR